MGYLLFNMYIRKIFWKSPLYSPELNVETFEWVPMGLVLAVEEAIGCVGLDTYLGSAKEKDL